MYRKRGEYGKMLCTRSSPKKKEPKRPQKPSERVAFIFKKDLRLLSFGCRRWFEPLFQDRRQEGALGRSAPLSLKTDTHFGQDHRRNGKKARKMAPKMHEMVKI